MIQTCTRCRSRRIKCDSLLPACTNCAKSELECTFRDDALQTDIPEVRAILWAKLSDLLWPWHSYIQSLNDRIQELSAQLNLHQSTNSEQEFHALAPGTGSDLNLDLSFPSLVANVAFGALSGSRLSHDASEMGSVLDADPEMPPVVLTEKSVISPPIIRFLIGQYARRIQPHYDVVQPETLCLDGSTLKKMQDGQKFETLMVCAIAATCESYHSPNWKPVAQICRDWAGELVSPMISSADTSALRAVLLLLIYEFADPSRGLVWELLDLAIRVCLQLGWLHGPSQLDHPSISADQESFGQVNASMSDEFRLVSTLKSLNGALQTVFCRPNMLSGSARASSDKEIFLETHAQLYEQLYGSGRVYESRGCPCVGDVYSLTSTIENHQEHDAMVASETWILLLPVCVKHKQCAFCFQEPDDHDSKGMTTLRLKVVDAASRLINNVHRVATAADGFISPFIATSTAFVSGCCIAVSISKRWISLNWYMKDVVKCTEVLALFAPHWKGGNAYLRVWRVLLSFLDENVNML